MFDAPTDGGIAQPDLVLAVIGLPIFVAAVLGTALSVPLVWPLGAGSVPATGGIGYALFYRPPRVEQ